MRHDDVGELLEYLFWMHERILAAASGLTPSEFRSIDTVTTFMRECRNAAMAAHLSIIERMTPPKTWPRLFASCGIISSEVSCCDSLTVLAGRFIAGGGRW